MTSFQLRTAALLAVGIALMEAPSFAQGGGRRNGGESGRREGVERAQPREGGGSRRRVQSQRRVEPGGRVERRGGAEPRGRVESRGRVASRGRVEPYGGYGNRTYGNRAYDNRAYDNRAYGNRAYGNRAYGNRSYGYRSHSYRSYGHRSYRYGSYGYRPYVYRSYVLPYGYRPHGYRPGWSLNLYFGLPYATYGYPTYGYGYPAAGYGYHALVPGRAYGAVRIVDAPPDAQVFVDGYYAGVVDDYDGVFQHLNLEAGPHHIEIEEQGYPPIAFDVRVEPGQTITYRANIR